MNKQKLVNIFEKHSPMSPMTMEESKIMVNIMMSKEDVFSIDINEIDKGSNIYKHFEPLITAFQTKVFINRIKNFTTFKLDRKSVV